MENLESEADVSRIPALIRMRVNRFQYHQEAKSIRGKHAIDTCQQLLWAKGLGYIVIYASNM